jgi:hypothetical protein
VILLLVAVVFGLFPSDFLKLFVPLIQFSFVGLISAVVDFIFCATVFSPAFNSTGPHAGSFSFFLSTAAGPDLGLARLATLNLFVVSCFGCQAGHRTLASRVGSCYKSWSCALGHTILLCVFRSAREVNTWAAHGLLLATQVFGVLKLFRQDSSFLHPAPVFKFLSLFHI